MTLIEFVLQTFSTEKYLVRPRIVCKDGFSMSVQGSEGAYCVPRESCRSYSQMEIGFPSAKEELIMEYVEDADDPTNTIYGYVPCSIIQQVIDKHGGIDEAETFKKKATT